jgi:protein O-GlcNAc transferase
MVVPAVSMRESRRFRLLWLTAAGAALTAAALWLRLAWAPQHVGSPAEIAAMYTRLGSEAALAGRFTQAVEFYRRAAKQSPRNVDTWICLGSACADADDRAGALRALGTAQRLAPDQPEVDRAIARVYLRFGQFGEARRAAERALRGASEDPYTVVLLGLARAESLTTGADEARCEELMRRALALGYRGPEPFYGLGLVALHRHRPEQAIVAFRTAVERDPRSRTMRYRLASAYRSAGRVREAEREMEAFRRLSLRSQDSAPSLVPAPPAP